jgi:hypothetical protein
MQIQALIKDLLRMQEIYGPDMPVSLQQGLPNGIVLPEGVNPETVINSDFFICEEPDGDDGKGRMGLKLRAWPY